MDSMRGCGCCRMSGWDRRWDFVGVVGVLYSKGGREEASCGSRRACQPNSAKLNSRRKRLFWRHTRITFLIRLHNLYKPLLSINGRSRITPSLVTTHFARAPPKHVIIACLPPPSATTDELWMAVASVMVQSPVRRRRRQQTPQYFRGCALTAPRTPRTTANPL